MIDIGDDEWLLTFIENINVLRHHQFESNIEQKIVLNMTDLDNDDAEYISEILEKLKMNGLFEQCQYLIIKFPPKCIVQDLYHLIGKLSSIKSLTLNGMTFFPMVRIINKIQIDTIKEFDLLKMVNITTRRPLYIEYLENERHVDEQEIDECILRMLSCKELSICHWKNPGEYGHPYLARFQRKFNKSQAAMNEILHQQIKKCPIKCIEFYGGGMFCMLCTCCVISDVM